MHVQCGDEIAEEDVEGLRRLEEALEDLMDQSSGAGETAPCLARGWAYRRMQANRPAHIPQVSPTPTPPTPTPHPFALTSMSTQNTSS